MYLGSVRNFVEISIYVPLMLPSRLLGLLDCDRSMTSGWRSPMAKLGAGWTTICTFLRIFNLKDDILGKNQKINIRCCRSAEKRQHYNDSKFSVRNTRFFKERDVMTLMD